ncbi:hypothetical protein J6590_082123 [Homalodisca vitripennis]|nr:hypothetical protein J6590_082123 [Homalodisca vitripennis]
MTPLVESGSTFKLSVAIREYEDNEENRQSSAQVALIDPPRGRSSRTCSSRISPSMHTKATTPCLHHQEKEVSRIRPNFVNEKLPHIISVNERQANWRHGRKPIYCRSCKGILCLHDSTREKRVQGEVFGSS